MKLVAAYASIQRSSVLRQQVPKPEP